MKLPHSSAIALQLPFVSPTGYGLGKAGWVTARLGAGASLPTGVLKAWIEESYAAVGPKARRQAPPRPPRRKTS